MCKNNDAQHHSAADCGHKHRLTDEGTTAARHRSASGGSLLLCLDQQNWSIPAHFIGRPLDFMHAESRQPTSGNQPTPDVLAALAGDRNRLIEGAQ